MEQNFIDTMCDICENPKCLCKCSISWNYFDKILKTTCTSKIENGVHYSSLKISTMTLCFNFNEFINLKLLKEKLPESLTVKFSPGSKKSKIPKKKGTDSFYNSFDIKMTIIDHESEIPVYSNVSIFIFPNGKAKAAGIKTIRTIHLLLEELIELVNYVPGSVEHPELLAIENIKIQMICSDFKIKPIKEDPDGWCIKQEELKNLLVKHGLSATFSALSRYPGINLKIESKIEEGKYISLLIFRSGSIIITGGKNAKDISYCYNFITNFITENSKTLFYYDINEEIKQKKKKNKM
jgi:TATA-box binding protein (TBP) (component of TFIID and TFIIIB)